MFYIWNIDILFIGRLSIEKGIDILIDSTKFLTIKRKILLVGDGPLRKTLKGYRKLRVGDYRIVLEIDDNNIYILGICHRKDVYTRVEKRVN